VTQNGLGVINARGIYNGVVEVTVLMYDDDLVAMMSGGVLDVEPFLISRNTLGNGKTANSKSQRQMSDGGSEMWRWFRKLKWIMRVGVEVTVPK
jgi:hypothetical protein